MSEFMYEKVRHVTIMGFPWEDWSQNFGLADRGGIEEATNDLGGSKYE